jgi:integrase
MAYIRPVDPARPNGPQRIDVKRTVGNQQIRRSYTRATLAEAHICAGNAELDLDRGVDPDDRYRIVTQLGGMTLAQWAAIWRVGRGLVPRAQDNEDTYLDKHILPVLGPARLDPGRPDSLARLRIQRWVDGLVASGLAASTIRTIYGRLKTMILDAIDEPTVPITASPFVRVRLPVVEPSGRRALEPAEVGRLCRAFGPPHQQLAWTLGFSGARIGELLARDVTDWQPLAGIAIPPAVVRRRRGETVTRGGKTAAGIRVLTLCGSHRAMIRGYVGGRTAGPLFLNRHVGRVQYDTFLSAFHKARTKAGLPDVSPHWLRHTVKTWLHEDGVAGRAVDAFIGHRTAGMDGVYVHVTAAMRADILASLEDRWRQAHSLPPAAGQRSSTG